MNAQEELSAIRCRLRMFDGRDLPITTLELLEAVLGKLTTCPVCEKQDTDGLEACSECYNKHFASTLKLDRAGRDLTEAWDSGAEVGMEAATSDEYPMTGPAVHAVYVRNPYREKR